MESIARCSYNTEFGNILITSDGEAITEIRFTGTAPEPGASGPATPLTDRAASQLNEYFSGARRKFDLPLRPRGTAFQLAVWNALAKIPYGETRSYKQIAQAINNPNACRAVGGANNRNPIWIVIPCHRVIGSDGSPVGYGGGIEMKEKLLKLEKTYSAARTAD